MKKDCKTCKYAKLIKHKEYNKHDPRYLEGICRIPLIVKTTKKTCSDYEYNTAISQPDGELESENGGVETEGS